MKPIIRISAKQEDQKLLSQGASDELATENSVDLKDTIVKKPWGYEYLAFDNGQVAIWVLHIARKQLTSLHCHPRKSTALIVLQGEITVSSLLQNYALGHLDSIEIGQGCFHSTKVDNFSSIVPSALNGVWLIEIESPSCKFDLVRAHDAYGRKGQSYEQGDNLVAYPHEGLLRIDRPEPGITRIRSQYGCLFTESYGVLRLDHCASHALVAVLGFYGDPGQTIQGVTPGSLYTVEEIKALLAGSQVDNYFFLLIEEDAKMMRVADYCAEFLATLGIKEVFAVSGGGAMHLVDAIGIHPNLHYVAVHHEQAAAMAAEAYSRINRNLGAALFTTGPGGTNALTGVAGAWIDSIPVLYLSGQVTSDTLLAGTHLRQFGIQESDITTLVAPITKYAITLKRADKIRYELEKALYLATSGRPGPVWIDIPLDLQSQRIDPSHLESFSPPEKPAYHHTNQEIEKVWEKILHAKRPVIISGYGIHLAHAEADFLRLVERLAIPVVSSWTSSDLLDYHHPSYVGRSGIMGDRASNFVVQNADLLLILGSRMSIPQVGYNYKTFAREAYIIMVDIDPAEMRKPSLRVHLPIEADIGDFLCKWHNYLDHNCLDQQEISLDIQDWRDYTQKLKEKYPVVLPDYASLDHQVNSFYFIDLLSQKLSKEAIVVTDMGTSFTCTMQTFRVKLGQRLFTSSGHASMGFGLPGAIGACYGSNRQKTICIAGDGGLMMNLQELQTVAINKLPIILFVIHNGGYLTIKHMQQNHFGRYVGSEASSGVSTPDMLKIAYAFGIEASRIENHHQLQEELDTILAKEGPYLCEIKMPEEQPLIPRSSSLKRPDGSIVSKPLEDLYPFLERQEFLANMIIKPIEDLK